METIDLKGKKYVEYKELLNLAHEKGLAAIETNVIQIPNDDNGQLAVCHAVVEVNGKRYSGVGDASPRNTNKLIALHLVRMAETRAKGRAMRDALNIGQVMKEELGGDDSDPEPSAPDTKELIASIEKGEQMVHKNAFEAANSRRKHMGTDDFEKATTDQLVSYRDHLRQKYNEKQSAA